MSVKLRFQLVGKKNRPAFRLVAIESRKARDGAYIENLGFYDPYIADNEKKIRINKERAEYWLGVGALPSQTVLDFFKREKVSGLLRSKPKKKNRKKSAGSIAAGAAAGVHAATGAGVAGAAASPRPASGKPGKKPKPPKKAKD